VVGQVGLNGVVGEKVYALVIKELKHVHVRNRYLLQMKIVTAMESMLCKSLGQLMGVYQNGLNGAIVRNHVAVPQSSEHVNVITRLLRIMVRFAVDQ